MSRIRGRQFEQLGRRHHQAFVVRLRTHLCQCYGATWADMVHSHQQHDFVQRIVQQAPQWGFEAESDIAELAMLVLELRLARGAVPMPAWFAQVVKDVTLNPTAKLYQLISRWHDDLNPRFGQLELAPLPPGSPPDDSYWAVLSQLPSAKTA
jgi:hypothetical protein